MPGPAEEWTVPHNGTSYLSPSGLLNNRLHFVMLPQWRENDPSKILAWNNARAVFCPVTGTVQSIEDGSIQIEVDKDCSIRIYPLIPESIQVEVDETVSAGQPLGLLAQSELMGIVVEQLGRHRGLPRFSAAQSGRLFVRPLSGTQIHHHQYVTAQTGKSFTQADSDR